jgi:predicted transcriptional regulator
MAATTIKLSVETRERLRALGGATYEHTVIEALDALEANRFWSEAEAAAAWQSQLSESERQRRHEVLGEIDRAFDGIE